MLAFPRHLGHRLEDEVEFYKEGEGLFEFLSAGYFRVPVRIVDFRLLPFPHLVNKLLGDDPELDDVVVLRLPQLYALVRFRRGEGDVEEGVGDADALGRA